MIERMLLKGFFKVWPAQDSGPITCLSGRQPCPSRMLHASHRNVQAVLLQKRGWCPRLQRPPHVAIRSWSSISAHRAEASGYQLCFARIVAQTLDHHNSRPAGNSCWNG